MADLITRIRTTGALVRRAASYMLSGTSDGFKVDPFNPSAMTMGGGLGTLVDFYQKLGVMGDTTAGRYFTMPRYLSLDECEALASNPFGARIISQGPNDAVREWCEIKTEETRTADARLVDARLKALATPDRLAEGMMRGYTYARAFVCIGFDDPIQNWGSPPPYDARVRWLRTYDRRQFQVKKYQNVGAVADLGGASFGDPHTYAVHDFYRPRLDGDMEFDGSLQASGVVDIHHSRTLPFTGPNGRSLFYSLADVLAGFLSGARGVDAGLRNASVGVYEVKDLRKMVEHDEAAVRKHVGAIDRAKGLLNALILDAEREKFNWHNASVSGMADLFYSLCYLLCAASGLPMTLFFGMSPGGFSGGESEEKNWRDRVRWLQTAILSPQLLRLGHYLWREIGTVPEWGVTWASLERLSRKDEALVQESCLRTATMSVSKGLSQPDEERKRLYGGTTTDLRLRTDTALPPRRTEGEEVPVGIASTVSETLQAVSGGLMAPTAAVLFIKATHPAYIGVADAMVKAASEFRSVQGQPEVPGQPGAPSAAPAPASPVAAPAAPQAAPKPREVVAGQPPDQPQAAPDEAVPPPVLRPPTEGLTWRTGKLLAAELGISVSRIKHWYRQGKVSRGLPVGNEYTYAVEHVYEQAAEMISHRREPGEPELADDEDDTVEKTEEEAEEEEVQG